ncbi:MAG: lipoprotein-releasing ABC transporter permease subunit [Mariprofundaceae bacterium]
MRYEFLLAMRYLRSRRDERFVSLISWTSTVGVAIGVMTLIVVLSVMNGAAFEMRERILGFSAHVDVQGPKQTISEWRDWLVVLEKLPAVNQAAPYISAQVMVTVGSRASGAILKGVDHTRDGLIAQHIRHGDFFVEGGTPFQVVIGSGLARKLNVFVGDDLTVISPAGGITPSGMSPRMRSFKVAGIFNSGFYEYDMNMLVAPLVAVQRLNRLGDAVTGIELRTTDHAFASMVAREARAVLPPEAWVTDWMGRNRSLFAALKTERVAMGIILSLIVLVAVFNMVASLVMVVMERRKEIAILKTVGATDGSILRIFLCMGFVLTGLGSVIGFICGVTLAWKLDMLLAWIEQVSGVTFMSGDIYIIDHVPSMIDPASVAIVVSASLVMGFLATLYPAWRASKVLPAEALRYE